MSAMSIGRLRRQWEAHARRNARAAILTPSAEQPEWDEAAFLETGRSHVALLMNEADRLVPRRQRRRALDFGCGIGRLTVALADYYDEVVGVDIANSMVEQARQRNPAPDRIRYEHNTNPDLRKFPSGGFDFVCSWIVLQHMPPSLIKAYIAELVRLVAPGGLLVFQLPVDRSPPRSASGSSMRLSREAGSRRAYPPGCCARTAGSSTTGSDARTPTWR